MMDTQMLQLRLREVEDEIDDFRVQSRRLEGEIDEAEAALESARRIQREFDDFIRRRCKARDGMMIGGALRSVTGILNQVNRMLTGAEYRRARDQAEELGRIVIRKRSQYSEDLDYCKEELCRLYRQREALLGQYHAAVAAAEGGEAT